MEEGEQASQRLHKTPSASVRRSVPHELDRPNTCRVKDVPELPVQPCLPGGTPAMSRPPHKTCETASFTVSTVCLAMAPICLVVTDLMPSRGHLGMPRAYAGSRGPPSRKADFARNVSKNSFRGALLRASIASSWALAVAGTRDSRDNPSNLQREVLPLKELRPK